MFVRRNKRLAELSEMMHVRIGRAVAQWIGRFLAVGVSSFACLRSAGRKSHLSTGIDVD